jgi:hypothetical protein
VRGVLVEYNSNNSGGRWWLSDADWSALEAAGWRIKWARLEYLYTPDKRSHERDADGFPVMVEAGKGNSDWPSLRSSSKDGRWLGALAQKAYKHFDTPADAMREFELITGQDVTDEGCNCCGAPHSFKWDGGYASGEDCIAHMYGDSAPKSLREAAERLAP